MDAAAIAALRRVPMGSSGGKTSPIDASSSALTVLFDFGLMDGKAPTNGLQLSQQWGELCRAFHSWIKTRLYFCNSSALGFPL